MDTEKRHDGCGRYLKALKNDDKGLQRRLGVMLSVMALILTAIFGLWTFTRDNMVAKAGITNDNGDITITDATYTIENMTYVQVGNITVGSGGVLVLKNSVLEFAQTQDRTLKLRVENNGKLIMINSTVTLYEGTLNPDFDKFVMEFDNCPSTASTITQDSVLAFNGTVDVNNSVLYINNSELKMPSDAIRSTNPNLLAPSLQIRNNSRVVLADSVLNRMFYDNSNATRASDINVDSSEIYAINTKLPIDFNQEPPMNTSGQPPHQILHLTNGAKAYLLNITPLAGEVKESAIVVDSTSTAMLYKWLDINVQDGALLPIANATIHLRYHSNGTPVNLNPPQVFLDYLDKDPGDFNKTDQDGFCSLPILTDHMNASTYPNTDFTGNFKVLASTQDPISKKTYQSTYKSIAYTPYPDFNNNTREASLQIPEVLLPPVPPYYSEGGINLVVDDQETKVINYDFAHSGNIKVMDNGSLTLTGSNANIIQRENSRHYILVKDNGTLNIVYSTLSSNLPLNIYLYDNASVYVSGSRLNINAIGCRNNFAVSIMNSNVTGYLNAMNTSGGSIYLKDMILTSDTSIMLDSSSTTIINTIISGLDLIFDQGSDMDRIYSKDNTYLIDVSGGPGSWTLGAASPLVFTNAVVDSINDTFSQAIHIGGGSAMNLTNAIMADNTSVVPSRDATSKLVIWYWLHVYIMDANMEPLKNTTLNLYGLFNYTNLSDDPYVPRLIETRNMVEESDTLFMARAYINDTFVGNYFVNATKLVNTTPYNSPTYAVIMDNNNDTNVYFDALKPDLLITNASLSNPMPSVNNPVYIYVDIANVGLSSVSNFHLSIPEINLTKQINVSIDIGETKRVTFEWTPQEAMAYHLTILADSQGEILETDESNNDYDMWVNVVPTPDLYLDPLVVSNPTPIVNVEPVYINTTVYNDGETDLTDILVVLLDNDFQVDQMRVNISAGGSVDVSFSHTFQVAAKHTITVSVNPDRSVSESEYFNNNQSAIVTVIEKPDIYLFEDDIHILSQNTVNGSDILIQAYVHCVGATNNITITVNFYVDHSYLFYSKNLSINSSETKSINATWQSASPPGWHNITVEVISSVDERFDTNNQATKAIYIKSGPDLAVYPQDITWTPANPAEGEEVLFGVYVWNLGESNLSGPLHIYVAIWIDGTPHDSIELTLPLASGANETRVFGVPWNAVKGDHEITVMADSTNALSELNETNNIASTVIHVFSKPELYIRTNDIEYEVVDTVTGDYQNIHEKDTVDLTATVWNSGEGTARNVSIAFLIDNETIDVQVSDISQTISTGVEFSTEWVATGGNHTVTVIVDYGNTILEDNESNNQASLGLTVLYLPELNVDVSNASVVFTNQSKSNIALVVGDNETIPQEEYLTEGTNLNASVPIRNTGLAWAYGVNITVDFEFEPINGSEGVGEGIAYNVTNISALGTYVMNFTYTHLRPGYYVFTVTVDADDVVPEIDEENNTYEITLTVFPLPDIHISHVNVTSSYAPHTPNETKYVEGYEITFNVTVNNTGLFLVTNTTIALYIMDNNTPIELDSHLVGNMSAGASTYVLLSWVPNGTYDNAIIYIKVDADDNVTEANELNNMYKNLLQIEEKPPEGISVTLTILNGKDSKHKLYANIEATISGTCNYVDEDGNVIGPAKNITLIITINGVSFKKTTDANGMFTLKYTPPKELDGKMLTVSVKLTNVPDYPWLVKDEAVASSDIGVSKYTKPGESDILPMLIGIVVVLIIVGVIAAAYVMLKKKAIAEGGGAKCSVCGETIPIDATKCPKCGTEFGDMVECGNCGAVIPADSKVCPNCGVSFETTEEFGAEMLEEEGIEEGAPAEEEEEGEEGEEEEGDEVEEEEGMMRCYACGEMIPVESTSCPYCGTVFEEEEIIEEEEEVEEGEEEEDAMIECFNCGKSIPLSATKCPYCGTEFE